jgi:uncharacterized transporter YbjL
MIKKVLSFLFVAIAFIANAQESGPQMADTFREDGKIYVVISVLAIIFLSIVLFLIYLERKIKKLEDKIQN